jgi:type I restriction enzyme R subunit
VREIAQNLESKSAIPSVAAQMELLLALQTDQWWIGVTLPMLEDVRLRLRKLVRFVDPSQGYVDVFTDFEDDLRVAEAAQFDLVRADPKLRNYRDRVRRFIRDHQDHLTIRRLRNNEPVSRADISALEDILFSEDGALPREEYETIFGETPLGVLVRSVVGLDRRAAKAAFAEFLAQAPLHPDQIAFLDEIVEYLVKNGTLEPKGLFDTPFTHFHDQGLTGVMPGELASQVVDLVKSINRNADAA